MRATLRDWEHLLRLIVVVLLGIAAFLLLRGAVIPKDFGRYGHYRPAALDDISAKPPAFAGQAECALCHEDKVKERAAGRHAAIHCEACHGPQAAHVANPEKKPAKHTNIAALCGGCHEKDAAKPAFLPQVVTKQHNGDECNACHQPHQPKL